ncbi:MAG TPA: RsmG family class I SAM-dependent methyltransferase [Polyangiaceae bacterium]|nr:RsmG family class I SAM-dependent methyltransferase [Polyangiaceae bacterium]
MPAPKLAAEYRPRVERLFAVFGRDTASEAGRLLVEQATAFAELVVAWNDRVDLTAARDPDELVDLLFADAAAIARERAPRLAEQEEWLDVGSGVGAPGVALALLEPAIRMKLVEPRAKRVAFLRTLLHTLGRPDVLVERTRVETLQERSCDVAVSRATLPPADWLREGTRVARRDVWVLVARDAPPQTAGWEIARTVEYHWPLSNKERRALQYREISSATAL